MGIQTSLDAIHEADRLVDSMRLADDLALDAARTGGARTIRVLRGALESEDQLVAIAATNALAQVFDEQADVVLSDLLSSDRTFLREHAASALSQRLPRYDTVGRLIGLVVAGGFTGMVAQRTLEQWSSSAPAVVGVALEGTLIGVHEPGARYRLVETLGLVRARIASRPLLTIALDAGEDEHVRVAAVSALGQRRGDHGVAAAVRELARHYGYLGDVARLSTIDLSAPDEVPDGDRRRDRGLDPELDGTDPAGREGLTIAQLFLHADIDAGLTHAGSGDNGGIATLLVRLGDALAAAPSASDGRGASSGQAASGADAHAARDALAALADLTPGGAVDAPGARGVDRVVTLSRGSADAAVASVHDLATRASGHVYGRVPLLSDPVSSATAWPLRVAARRGIRRVLRAAGGVDLLHLRMADVGSLAAADVARELDIPVVFTVAPDPHAVIQSLDLSGALTRETFGDVDEVEHFWFRTRLVQQLASNASHTVLFPRPELERDMRELVGIDVTSHPERHTIVPEGIDLDVVDRSVAEAAEHAAGGPATPPLAELCALLESLPPERRGMPLLVSVGRLHRVKGMATIVEAWAGGAAGAPGAAEAGAAEAGAGVDGADAHGIPLRDRANLLLIGGDLEHPSADEREQLDLIDAIVPAGRHRASGLLLPGHRPNDTVARWVAAARFGLPGLAAPRGVYVCGSLKEEFGIALLEAMGSGLLVVAPQGGGPSTYVRQGDTGWLTRTWDVDALRQAMGEALTAAAAETTEARAARSRDTVERSFTIQAMARSLSGVYDTVHHDELEQREWSVSAR
ncbi:glycosyltransferase [Frigoribacterium sp. VKM Ac-1396]|uniref:glycosyltransferase n=1 Tax=Frigoribacterium sp. VKM Ac-1396 TaxID=2783821 RepID=UPI00188D4D97|nr:glycosyltransferase [Frigoribacterium sp. VKM Ac-1396]MBF4601763.1 glycosyltransferase [Frigoribacterium sp. VKM Ac-1396]